MYGHGKQNNGSGVLPEGLDQERFLEISKFSLCKQNSGSWILSKVLINKSQNWPKSQKYGFNSNSGNCHKNFTFIENLSTIDTSLSMLSYFPIIKSLYRKYNTMLLSSAQFQSLSLAVGQLRKLSYLSTVRTLYLTGIRIGIGINSHQDFEIRIGIKSKKCCWNWNWN